MKLNEGVTLEEATPLVHEVGVSEELEPFENFMGHVTFYGGPMLIAPGGRQQLILDLEPGQYLWICWVDAPDGEIHSDKGMIQAFEVVAATADAAMEAPVSDGTLALHDFSFELPDPIGTGPQVWEVVNDGAQPHEFFLAQLAPGVTAMDLLMAEDWEGLGMPFGGMAVIAPNVSSWLVLDLPPGSYAAFCFVPDPESGSAHLELGMMAEFTVADAT